LKASDILIIGGSQKFEAESVRKPSGAIILDGMHLADTLQCEHCGYTWIPIMGSGKVRGWCNKCNGPTCGSKECHECLPMQKRIEQYEKGVIKILK
jgi:uncharacterized ferredoxin-like protein